ncbi:MAG: hypothetical protein Rubg2KO_07120 [Rubricoccaceae bacterium]
MLRFVFFVALAILVSLPAVAQTSLDGVMLGSTGPAPAGNAISLFNPDAAALNRVGVTINTYQSHGQGGRADTLGTYVRPASGFGIQHHASYSPALSAQGRIAFVADWFGPDPSDVQVMAVDRDGRNITVLTDPIRIISSLAGSRVRVDISPDGQTVLYVLAGRQTSGAVPDTMWTVPSDGSASPTAFAFTPLAACEQGAARAVFSPDGTEIAYLGWMQIGTGPNATCELAVRAMDADGANDRVVFGPLERGFNEEWSVEQIALDWKADRILFSWPSLRPGAGSSHPRRVSVLDAVSGTILHEVQALTDVDDDSYQLSPDGLAVGYVKQVHPSVNPGQTWVEVRRLSDDTEILNLEAVYTHGSRPFFDWADAPPVPTPARLEIRQDVLLWEGREVDLAPRLLDADGNVISYVVDTWSYERGPVATSFPRINHFTNRIWAGTDGSVPGSGTGNGFGNKVCAQQGGLETCRTHNVVNTPIFDIEILDDDIAEQGRNPGRIRVTRYGPHDETATPRLVTSRTARHYLDYTLSALPGVYRWAASSNLADTLQVREITITPIDDAVDEPEIEEADLTLQCDSFPNESNSNCAAARPGQIPGVENGIGIPSSSASLRWRFEIQSNGAGSGVGIASSRPQRASNEAATTLTILGQSFGEDATVSLSGPSALTASSVIASELGSTLHALFDLAGASPGTYDLTVTSGGESSTLAGALIVEATQATVDVWSEVLGDAISRSGGPSIQRIVYGNDGNTDAVMVPIRVAFPANAEVRLHQPLIEWPTDLVLPPDSLWLASTERVQPPCTRGGVCPEPMLLDMQVAVFYVPVIAAGGRGGLTFTVTLSGSSLWTAALGRPMNTISFDQVSGTGRVGSTEAGQVALCSSGQHAGAQDEATEAACAECHNLLVSGNPISRGCVRNSYATLSEIAHFDPELSFTGDQTVNEIKGQVKEVVFSGLSVQAEALKNSFACSLETVPGPAQVIQAYRLLSVPRVREDVSISKACATCFGLTIGDAFWLNVVFSADPNEKVGPYGTGEDRFVAEFGRIPYRISFENLPSATASAYEVVVTDTLDTETLDLSTFELGAVILKDTTFTPPTGIQAWTTYWDRRPAVPSTVRIDASLDAETGIVIWQLSDLDPNTFTLRTSVDAGFLPPNDAEGSGEGSVLFTVAARDDLPDGTAISNHATIGFDRNELIVTDVWTNTLDRTQPTSRAIAVQTADTDTSYVVRIEGVDGGAGIGIYDLYAQAPGGPFQLVGSTAQGDAIPFQGEPGVVYGLFALATDRVGNTEAPKTVAEAFTDGTVDAEETASSLPTELTLAPPYPNPSSGPVVFQVGLPGSGAVDLRVFDVQGREVARVFNGELAAGWHAAPWDASALPAGVYVVHARTPTGTTSSRLTIAR